MSIDWFIVLYIVEAASASLGVIAVAVTFVAMWDAAANRKYHEAKRYNARYDALIFMLAHAEFRRELTRTMSQFVLLSVSIFNILIDPPPEYILVFTVNVLSRTLVQLTIFYASLRERFDRDRVAEELEITNGPKDTYPSGST